MPLTTNSYTLNTLKGNFPHPPKSWNWTADVYQNTNEWPMSSRRISKATRHSTGVTSRHNCLWGIKNIGAGFSVSARRRDWTFSNIFTCLLLMDLTSTRECSGLVRGIKTLSLYQSICVRRRGRRYCIVRIVR